jgi:hypothetical protein
VVERPCRTQDRVERCSPIALLFGLYSLIYSVSEIVLGVRLPRTGTTLHSVLLAAA